MTPRSYAAFIAFLKSYGRKRGGKNRIVLRSQRLRLHWRSESNATRPCGCKILWRLNSELICSCAKMRARSQAWRYPRTRAKAGRTVRLSNQADWVVGRRSSMYLPLNSLPAEDQRRWQAAFRVGDRFDGSGPGSHLAEATRQNLTDSYGRFLRFVLANRYDLLNLMPDERVNRRTVADYVEWRGRSCGDPMI